MQPHGALACGTEPGAAAASGGGRFDAVDAAAAVIASLEASPSPGWTWSPPASNNNEDNPHYGSGTAAATSTTPAGGASDPAAATTGLRPARRRLERRVNTEKLPYLVSVPLRCAFRSGGGCFLLPSPAGAAGEEPVPFFEGMVSLHALRNNHPAKTGGGAAAPANARIMS